MAEDKKPTFPDFAVDFTDKAIRRPLMHGCGYTDADLKKPLIGVANTWTELNPGHVHLNKIAEKVREGIKIVDMTPFGFNTIAPCDAMGEAHEGMKYILPAREIIAASIEIMARVNLLDGLVLIGSCDKIVPALLMAAARVDIPSIVITGGYHMPYCINHPAFPDESEFAFPEIGKFFFALVEGRLTEAELDKTIQEIVTGPGACPEMGTAMTMQCMAEALGMALPHSSIHPALSDEKLTWAVKTGEALRKLIENQLTPSRIMTEKSFENAIKVLLTMGGSTNGLLHLPAIAHELDIDLSLEQFDRLSDQTPVTCELKPNGPRAIHALNEAGGVPVVMKNLVSLLNRDVLNVSGQTLAETLDKVAIVNNDIIRPLDQPVSSDGGLVVLRGNLAPDGSIVKKSAVTDDMKQFIGPARIFECEEDAIQAILKNDVKSGACVVIRNEGPKGGPGMREMSISGHMMQVSGLGKTCAMITDGRFSGTNYGLLIGHISPEAADGGPLALVEDGDLISIDIVNKSIQAEISKKEWARRHGDWSAPEPKYRKGLLAWYRQNVSSADKGAILKYRNST